ncbi:MAG: putative Ig domain-containing protein [Rhizobacter sp.]|nr:putative Ig domain-containing protein [Bacteriovorax sp.]
MKTFNTKLIVPFIITLFLTGCMPDSLTKFKKDAPTKAATSSTTTTSEPSGPVVDPTGAVVPFTAPTFFYMGTTIGKKFSFTSGSTTPISQIKPNIDGSLGGTLASSFILNCTVSPALPSGLTLSSACHFNGNPTISKSVVTPFCSDPAYTTQTACESAPQVWTAGATYPCSNTDFQYNVSSASCVAVNNKWYGVGAHIPYKIGLKYRDSAGTVSTIYTTMEIGTYEVNPKVVYSQADKLLLAVAASTYLDAIVPVRTLPSVTPSAYSNTNIIAASNGAIGVANFVDSSQNSIGVRKLVKMTLSNASAYAAGRYITTAGNVKVGKIFKKDTSNTNVIYVENISDGEIYFAKNDIIDNVYPYAGSASIATINSIDESGQFTFAVAPGMDNDRQFYQQKFSMTTIPANTYLINSPTSIKPITPLTAVKPNNGTIFSSSPKLPAGLTLNPLTGVITGKFLTPLPITVYTITAANPVDTQSVSLKLSASNAPADLSLSTKQIITVSTTAFFTEGETLYQQIIPPLATAPTGKIIKIFTNQQQMSVEASEGAFLAGASLDSGTSAFYSEKAYIIPDKSCVDNNYTSQDACEIAGSVWSTGPVYYNLGLKLSNTSTVFALGACSDPTYTTQDTCEEPRELWDESAGIDADGDGVVDGLCTNPIYTTQNTCEEPNGVWGPSYVTTVAGTNVGAKAIIAGIYKNATNDTLYVRHLTQNATGVATAKTFYEGDTVSFAPLLKIDEIESSTIKMALSDVSTYKVGKDVTSATNPAAVTQAGGYTYYRSPVTAAPGTPGVISVSDISHSPGVNLFRKNDHLYNDEFTTTPAVTNLNINSVTHDIHLIAEVKKPFSLNTTISTTNVLYSIVPALPAGLALDTKTGKISGTPTTITAKKDYLLSATNFTGQTTYAFSLEVRDYLTLKEISGAPSFFMHKIGDTQVDRKCRINAADIINNVGGLDIRCNLEAEEEDLNFNAIKLQAVAGAGICQYIKYQPYYLWQYAPLQSTGLSAAYPATATVKQGCSVAGTAPTQYLCDGNYSTPLNTTAPNCDEGHLDYTLETWAFDTSPVPVCTLAGSQTIRVACGGRKTNCIQGPVKDLLSDTEVANGFRSVIYQTPNGFSQTWPLTSPIGHGDKSNMRVANFTRKNLCTASNTDVNQWAATAASIANTVAPYGKTNPYYVINCLDAASQIKARIRLIVRDWDRNFKLNNGLDLIDPSTTTTGVATDANGAFMDNALIDSFGNPYNNHIDYDDTGANFTGGSCGVVGGGTEYPFPGAAL